MTDKETFKASGVTNGLRFKNRYDNIEKKCQKIFCCSSSLIFFLEVASCFYTAALLNLSLPSFRRHLSPAFSFFNKQLLEKKLIGKVERLNVKQRRSR